MKKLLTILISYILIGCTSIRESSSNHLFFSSELKNSLIDTIYFENSRILQLEVSDNSLLRTINRMYYDDNRFFVFDKSLNKIVIFDNDGKYLNQIHQVGNGPSEYISLMDFCLDTLQQRLILLCDRPNQIMEFTYSGDFVKLAKVDNLYFNIASDSKYIYSNSRNMRMDKPNKHAITIRDRDYNIVSQSLTFDESSTVNHQYRGCNLNCSYSICYTRQFDNTIYKITDGQLFSEYSIDFGKYEFPIELSKRESNNFSSIATEKKYIYAINDVVDSPNLLFFKTNIGLFVLDKDNEVLEGYTSLYDSKFRIGHNDYLPIGNTQTLAMQISPSTILNIYNRVKENKANTAENKALIKLAEKVNEDSNPILILYKIK